MTKEFIKWLIKKYLPDYHLAKNPPKGTKKPRMVNEPPTTTTTVTGMLRPEDEGKTWNYTEKGEMTMRPIIGKDICFNDNCQNVIPEDDKIYPYTGICESCREEEQKRALAEFRRDERREGLWD